MTAPEEQARRDRYLARAAYQKLLDALMAGSAVARAALADRYAPVDQYQKEGPYVGERDESQSTAGRIT